MKLFSFIIGLSLSSVSAETLRYKVPVENWADLPVDVLSIDTAGQLVGLHADGRQFLKISDEEAAKLVQVLELIKSESIEKSVTTVRKKLGSSSVIPPYDILKARGKYLSSFVGILGDDRGLFFFSQCVDEAFSCVSLQVIGATIVKDHFRISERAGGNELSIERTALGVDGKFEKKHSVKITGDAFVSMAEKIKLKKMVGKPSAIDSASFEHGRLLTGREVLGMDLYEESRGGNPDFVAMLPLTEVEKKRFTLLLEQKRHDYLKLLIPLVKKETDKLGSLVIRIPEHRKWGKDFAQAMLKEIEGGFGAEVASYFSKLSELDKDGRSLAPVGIARAFYEFGRANTYVIRGGKKEFRLEEIPQGELWVQSTEGKEDVREAYDYSIELDPYEKLPLFLKSLISEQEVEPYKGRGHFELHSLIMEEKLNESVYRLLEGADNKRPADLWNK